MRSYIIQHPFATVNNKYKSQYVLPKVFSVITVLFRGYFIKRERKTGKILRGRENMERNICTTVQNEQIPER